MGGVGVGDLLAGGVFGRGAEGEDGAAGLGDEGGGGFGVAFGGPLFGGAAGGSGEDGNPWLGEAGEFCAHVFEVLCGGYKPGGVKGAAVFAGEEQVEIFEDLMGAAGAEGGFPDLGQHEVAGEMSRETDAFGDVGKEGGGGGAEGMGEDV